VIHRPCGGTITPELRLDESGALCVRWFCLTCDQAVGGAAECDGWRPITLADRRPDQIATLHTCHRIAALDAAARTMR
jgi:hypothetical protein